MTSSLTEKGRGMFEEDTKEKAIGGQKHWSDVITGQGTPGASRNWKR